MKKKKKMEIVRKQTARGLSRFLILTDPDPKTGTARAITVDVQAQTVARVKNAAALLRSADWRPLTPADPDLDELVRRVPALRRHRGIEIRLPSGVTAWILWRQWSSASADTQRLLMEATAPLHVPAYEPDADYFLAVQAASLLGGMVLDAPRSVLPLGQEAY